MSGQQLDLLEVKRNKLHLIWMEIQFLQFWPYYLWGYLDSYEECYRATYLEKVRENYTHTTHTDMDTQLQALFKKLLNLPGTITQSYTLGLSYKGLNNFRKKKRKKKKKISITKYLLQVPILIKPLLFSVFIHLVIQMSFCNQLNSSCICPVLKGKSASVHGSTTQRNGHISSLGQDVANLKRALHPSRTASSPYTVIQRVSHGFLAWKEASGSAVWLT